jgi:hypothetical protein
MTPMLDLDGHRGQLESGWVQTPICPHGEASDTVKRMQSA